MLLFLLREMFCSWLLKLSCQECAVSSTVSKCLACLEFNLNYILRSGFQITLHSLEFYGHFAVSLNNSLSDAVLSSIWQKMCCCFFF